MSHLRALGSPYSICASWARRHTSLRQFSASPIIRDAPESNLPRIAQPTFWSSLIPRSLRSRTASSTSQSASKPWNPATIFIFLGILIGSNAIQIIALRNEMLNFSRKTDAKLSLLREVVQRVKSGEEVDVRGLVGTGDPKSEAEWEEVMKELEGTDMVAEGKRKREEKRKEKARLREEAEAGRRRERDAAAGGEGKDGGARPKFMM